MSFVDRYEDQLKELAAVRGCRGIICGPYSYTRGQAPRQWHPLPELGRLGRVAHAIVEQHPGDFESSTTATSCNAGDLDGAIGNGENDFVEIEEGEKVRRTALAPA